MGVPASGRFAMKRLIVTADDFGLALPVNEAVEEGHARGILSAASLMVTGDAAADAVERAHRLPRLAVGLHLVLVDGRPALPPAAIPDLVTREGRFHQSPLVAGVAIFCRPAARRQLEAEIRAQLDAFRRTGLTLDHVDAHHHFHVHPTVRDTLLRLALEYAIPAVRVPHEPPLLAWRATGDRLAARLLGAALHGGRMRAMKRRLDRAGIAHNDWLLGLTESGAMTPRRVQGYLARLPDGVSELYVHPATRAFAGPDAWPASYDGVGELRALVDPETAAALQRAGIEPTSFAALGSAR